MHSIYNMTTTENNVWYDINIKAGVSWNPDIIIDHKWMIRFLYIFLSVFQISCVMKRQLLRETREECCKQVAMIYVQRHSFEEKLSKFWNFSDLKVDKDDAENINYTKVL